MHGKEGGSTGRARHRWVPITVAVVLATLAAPALRAERINHAGRILGPLPVVTNAVLFDTPEADAIVAALQVFPADHAWNEDITRRPLLPNSDAMIAGIITALGSTRQSLRVFYEMNFVLVPDDQPAIPINFFNYPDESDPSPYPIPANLPIEGWPVETGNLTLDAWQQDLTQLGGDRHAIIVRPGTGGVWETWLTQRVGTNWQASNGARFDLNSNALRPDGWTSADAAGLCMFGGLVRYDECERGQVEHAVRLVVARTRQAYLYPATHQASSPVTTDPNVPAMGQRLRLKASFVIPASWTREEQAVLLALRQYGAIVSDNGGFFSISVAPDPRFPAGAFDHLASVSITNFEVIQTTGPTDGPRSPGAPHVDAGPDQVVTGADVVLAGGVFAPSQAQIAWKLYDGPGPAAFDDATRTNTTVHLASMGRYTLMLRADDGVHTPAYDAVVMQVVPELRAHLQMQAGAPVLSWQGGAPPYSIERTVSLGLAASWGSIGQTSGMHFALPVGAEAGFYRVRCPPGG